MNVCLYVQSVVADQEPQENKYTGRPPRELKSHFLAQQEKEKQEAEEAALLQKQKLQEVKGRNLYG